MAEEAGNLEEAIAGLEDARAERVLAAVAQARVRAGEVSAERAADLAPALRQEFAASPDAAATRGELTRQALRVLAGDPAYRGPLQALVTHPLPERYAIGPVETTLLITGALLALQTEVDFERDKEGRWRVRIRRKGTSEALLKPLVEKLLGLLGRGGG